VIFRNRVRETSSVSVTGIRYDLDMYIFATALHICLTVFGRGKRETERESVCVCVFDCVCVSCMLGV